MAIARRDTDMVRRLLKSKDKVEALDWLAGASPGVYRNIGEMTNQESVAYVRKLYKLGATNIPSPGSDRSPKLSPMKVKATVQQLEGHLDRLVKRRAGR